MNFWQTVLANTLGGVFSFAVIGLVGLLLKSQIVAYLKQEAPTWWDTSIIALKSIVTTGTIAAIISIIAFVMSFFS